MNLLVPISTFMRIRISLLFISVVLTTLPTISQQQVLIQGKEETIYPVDAASVHASADLLPLKLVLQDKDVIAMGEATHGTKEFFELKTKMFRYLVEEQGVKVFGIEATYAGCLYINDYVREGEGNLDSVMKRFGIWTWQTEEMKQLLLWMRHYNQNKKEEDKLSFYGFDIQSFNAPLHYLYDYIRSNHQADAPAFLKLIAPLYNREKEIYKAYFTQHHKQVLDTLETVYAGVDQWFTQNDAIYKQANNPKNYQQLRLCLQNLRESVQFLKAGTGQYAFRDSCMAGMVQQIKNIEKAKIFLWAHNYHVTKHRNMGSHLKKLYGEQFYTIGFVFHQGGFQALKTQSSHASKLFSRFVLRRRFMKQKLVACSVSASPQGSLASTFSQLQHPSFFIDIASNRNNLFVTPQLVYNIGAVFMNRNNGLQRLIPVQHYDGLLFVNTTRPTQLHL